MYEVHLQTEESEVSVTFSGEKYYNIPEHSEESSSQICLYNSENPVVSCI